MPQSSCSGQRIVITGGGTGIGRATALAFAERGAGKVIVTGRRHQPLAEVAAEHPAIVPVVADVTSDGGGAAVAAAVRDTGGAVDVLVHNAGILRATPLSELDTRVAEEVFHTNVLGPMRLTARLLPMLSDGASVVLVSSIAGRRPTAGIAAYAASKAALDCLARAWALELADRRIRVNAVAPVATHTPVWSAAGFSAGRAEAVLAAEAARTPLGRNCTVDDVAAWILRLSEPETAFVTGQVITIGGGADLV